uniref:Retrotransposon Copia-like N-terminal domain-containing protein n=1 Tax=Cajanus cajan TaxID=3821 RepID=A0A151RKJ3_CAJCA|nr:hypothetical protein KK1_035512 [Cajanus cajan]
MANSNSSSSSNLKNILSIPCSVKLDRKNYRLWKSLVLPSLKGHNLDGYLFGTTKCPPEFIIDETGKKNNPAFADWTSTDQLLLGWLINSMTQEVATQLLHCETSQQIWEDAQSLAGAHTRSRITFLKTEFHRTRKGGLKMEEYFTKMKEIADDLALAGSSVSTMDLVTQTLAGLDNEYNPIVVQLSDKEHLTWVEMQAQLLTYENRLEQINNLSNLTLNPSANIATRGDNRRGKSNSFGGWRGGQINRGARGGKGRGRATKDRIVCQVCCKLGHAASHCYHRFNKNYMGQNSDEQKSEKDKEQNYNFNAYLASSSTVEDPD